MASIDDVALVLNDYLGRTARMMLTAPVGRDEPANTVIITSVGTLEYEPAPPDAPPGRHGAYRVGTAAFSLDVPQWNVTGLSTGDSLTVSLDARGARITLATEAAAPNS